MLAAAGASLLESTDFWVGAAFFIFLLFLIIKGVPGIIAKALDERAQVIRRELDDARRLREEAQNLLSDYQRKSRQAEEEAKSIVEQAKREADALAAEARQSLHEMIVRRTKQAEEKIAMAEAKAFDEVRSATIDKAIAAAENVLRAKVVGSKSDQMIEYSIQDLRSKLN